MDAQLTPLQAARLATVGPAAAASPRQPLLELFRFLAAVEVLLFHFHEALGWPDPTWFKLPAVDLFFVLSGIVLGAKYGDGIRSGDITWRRFAWHRLRRLYPMLLVSLLVSWMVAQTGIPQGVVLEARDPGLWSGLLLWPCRHGCDVAYPGNPPTWAMFAEIAANAIWFVTLVWAPRLIAWVGAICACVFLGAVWSTGIWHIGWSPGVVGVGLGVARAAAFFILGDALRRWQVARTWPRSAVLLVVVAALALHASGWLRTIHPALSLLGVALAGSVLLAHLSWQTPGAPGWGEGWGARAAVWLGALSYPLYLNQAAGGRIGEYLLHHDGVPAWVAFLLVPMALGVAIHVGYRYLVAPWLEPRLGALDF